ncbi:MAG TPA: hypothetical protein ENJ69_00080 [Bacteroidetes bacterium]|nr:hypothetical protein [Bacteroidota bacterium]
MNSKPRHSLWQGLAMTLNWLVAGMMLLAYLAQKEAPSQHTAVAVFGLVYPVLLLANLFFIAFWLLQKNSRWLLSLLILLVGFSHLKTNLNFSFHLRQNNPGPTAIKVMSYNVQGFARSNRAAYNPEIKKGILTFLAKQNPDILCLQEYSGKKRDLFRRKNNKNAYFHSYYTQKGSKNTGLVIVTRYKIFQKGFLKFKNYRTFGIFSDIVAGNDTLRVINVHLASISLEQDDLDLLSNPPSSRWKKQNVTNHFADIYHKLQRAFRLRERQLSRVIRTIQTSPWPVVLCGDFNDTPSSWAYHRIATLLTDAFVEKGTGLGATYAGPLPFLRIDYLFAGKKYKVLSYQKYNLRFSDHYPVSMQIKKIR